MMSDVLQWQHAVISNGWSSRANHSYITIPNVVWAKVFTFGQVDRFENENYTSFMQM